MDGALRNRDFVVKCGHNGRHPCGLQIPMKTICEVLTLKCEVSFERILKVSSRDEHQAFKYMGKRADFSKDHHAQRYV